MHDDDDEFRVTLTIGGRPVMYGWWRERTAADRKFVSWIGDYSGIAGARIVLEARGAGGTWRQVKVWPGSDSPAA